MKNAPVLVEGADGKAHLIKQKRLGSTYLGNYESRQTKAEMLFRVQQHRKGTTDAAHLSAAFQYHRLALLATSAEARFINLWIALEALCQGGEESIIERVCERVAPCVSVDNMRKTFVSLAVYVRLLWRGPDQAAFLALFPNSKKDNLDPEELLALLLRHEKDKELETLFDLCGRHPLIVHRLLRTKDMTLAKPSKVAENLEYTLQNVKWQLGRIYRVRNLIVHSGQGAKLLPQLTQHLHSYLVKTIHSVLEELDRQPAWTIRDALEHRSNLFKHVVRTFKNTERPVSVGSLLYPDACLRPQVEPFAWPLPAKAEGKGAGKELPPAKSK